jgi:hypothetical protein
MLMCRRLTFRSTRKGSAYSRSQLADDCNGQQQVGLAACSCHLSQQGQSTSLYRAVAAGCCTLDEACHGFHAKLEECKEVLPWKYKDSNSLLV